MDTMYPQADAMQFTRMGEQGWELVGFENGAGWFKKEVEDEPTEKFLTLTTLQEAYTAALNKICPVCKMFVGNPCDELGAVHAKRIWEDWV